jgi:hypothetical protein
MSVDWDAYWASFDTCWRCGAKPGQRCHYVRYPHKSCWVAHHQRKKFRR